jgi:hypothetical protein
LQPGVGVELLEEEEELMRQGVDRAAYDHLKNLDSSTYKLFDFLRQINFTP